MAPLPQPATLDTVLYRLEHTDRRLDRMEQLLERFVRVEETNSRHTETLQRAFARIEGCEAKAVAHAVRLQGLEVNTDSGIWFRRMVAGGFVTVFISIIIIILQRH